MYTFLVIACNFIAGTLCLMYGVSLMSSGLEKANPMMMKKILMKFTGNTFAAFISGTLLTALVQSSAAVTVITVGLVNSGLMSLAQAVGIIYGANLGTTVTAQLMSLSLYEYALPILAASLVIRFVFRKEAVKSLATGLTGLGLLFLGIGILSSSVPIVKENQQVYELFMIYGKNPYIGLLIGLITTMLVQSSSATVGLTIVLYNSGLLGYEAALGLTLGDNIGTCITAQLASLGTSLPARRTAWAHTLYNVLGVFAVMLFLDPFSHLVKSITSTLGQDESRLVANTHTLFNILSAAIFLPVTRYYVRFIEKVVRS